MSFMFSLFQSYSARNSETLDDLCVLYNSPFLRLPYCQATQRSINRWPMKRCWHIHFYLDLQGQLGLQVSFFNMRFIFSILFLIPFFCKPVTFLCLSQGAQGPKVPLVLQDKWGHQACLVPEATWGPWDLHRTCRISNRDAVAQWYVSVFISNL